MSSVLGLFRLNHGHLSLYSVLKRLSFQLDALYYAHRLILAQCPSPGRSKSYPETWKCGLLI